MNIAVLLMASLVLLSPAACSREQVIPEHLEGRVEKDLRYVQVKENPEAYRGKLMLAGGKVLKAKRLQEGTRIEILQYPLSEDLIPATEDEPSKGRFVAIDLGDKNVIDPVVLEKEDDEEKLVTVVGEVMGTTTVKIDQVQQPVPELAIKHITVWDRDNRGYWPYYGYYPPYRWGYGGYYGYPYYW
ncbi:Slp family lipoprotein [Nitrospira moscoviensis]|uniref:Putative Outer membrane lipoprotein, Slp family n=1 Tax=Nitrospira moscoviensis TaxID=42253 RepID=A0A0K2GDU7_NITMO|nr:Slp family lipoprotein [Nitrospira moscoviensis]ALA59123.1 Putative Outer membrane lipoprotein, Slp family [Nitrospira moscoviensis]